MTATSSSKDPMILLAKLEEIIEKKKTYLKRINPNKSKPNYIKRLADEINTLIDIYNFLEDALNNQNFNTAWGIKFANEIEKIKANDKQIDSVNALIFLKHNKEIKNPATLQICYGTN